MEGKICKFCGKFIALDLLTTSKSKTGKIYYNNRCRDCDNKRRKDLTKTLHGLIDQIYGCNVKHSKRRGHNPPKYSKDELRVWLLDHPDFDRLYENWVASDYDRLLIPSVDRIDDNAGYSLSNIRLVTFRQNQEKSYYQRRNGLSVSGEICEPVVQITLDGEFVARYISAMDAERQTGIGCSNIRCCAIGKHNQRIAKGFVWVFEKEYVADPEKWHKKTPTRTRRVAQFNMRGDVINTFNSLKEAADSIGTFVSAIGNALKGRCKTCKGFVWKYAD